MKTLPPRADRDAAAERRQQIAEASSMPPALAERFTSGQLAVLEVVAREVAATGVCELYTRDIAARASICTRLVTDAIRYTVAEGVVTTEHRPRRGGQTFASLVRIVQPDWQSSQLTARHKPFCERVAMKVIKVALASALINTAPAWAQSLTVPQNNAARSAKQYISFSGFSQSGTALLARWAVEPAARVG